MWVEKHEKKFKAVERVILPDGSSKRISVMIEKNTPRERRAAAEILRRRADDLTRNVSDFRLSEVIEDYLSAKKAEWKLSTYNKTRRTLGVLLRVIGNIKVNDLSAGYIRSRLRGKTENPTTFNEYLKQIKSLLTWAYMNDYLANPDCYQKLQRMKELPKKLKVKDKFLELDEYEKLLAAMPSEKWRLVTEFLVLSGLRIGEFIALDDQDVDFEKREIQVTKTFDANAEITTTTKTLESTRTIHMQPELIECAQKLRQLALRLKIANGVRSDCFLPSPDGSRMKYYAYRKYFKKYTGEVLGRTLTPHSLRHSHVALMASKGMPLEVLSRRLGHASIGITKDIYFHVTKGLKEADARLYDAVSLL